MQKIHHCRFPLGCIIVFQLWEEEPQEVWCKSVGLTPGKKEEQDKVEQMCTTLFNKSYMI